MGLKLLVSSSFTIVVTMASAIITTAFALAIVAVAVATTFALSLAFALAFALSFCYWLVDWRVCPNLGRGDRNRLASFWYTLYDWLNWRG